MQQSTCIVDKFKILGAHNKKILLKSLTTICKKNQKNCMCFKMLLKYMYTCTYTVYKVLTFVNQLLYNIGLFSATCLSILGKCFKATVSIFSSVHILSSSRTKL